MQNGKQINSKTAEGSVTAGGVSGTSQPIQVVYEGGIADRSGLQHYVLEESEEMTATAGHEDSAGVVSRGPLPPLGGSYR